MNQAMDTWYVHVLAAYASTEAEGSAPHFSPWLTGLPLPLENPG